MTERPAHTDEHRCARAWTALSAGYGRVNERLCAALTEECGLATNEFAVLVRLVPEGETGLRLGDLMPTAGLTQPSLSRLVARLERRGLLARSDDAGDGRGVRVALTAEGNALVDRATTVHARVIHTELLDRLTPEEQDVLAAAMERIALA